MSLYSDISNIVAGQTSVKARWTSLIVFIERESITTEKSIHVTDLAMITAVAVFSVVGLLGGAMQTRESR